MGGWRPRGELGSGVEHLDPADPGACSLCDAGQLGEIPLFSISPTKEKSVILATLLKFLKCVSQGRLLKPGVNLLVVATTQAKGKEQSEN